jgi:hypothetical protein
MRDAVVIFSSCPEHLDTGKPLIEPDLYLVEKPGEVHNGKPNRVNGLGINIPERWG